MEAAPYFADVADGPEGGAAHWLTTEDGLRIRVGHWTGPEARGTVLIFPGRTEYVEKYGREARDLLARGFATVAIDWRGQGIASRMQDDPAVGHVDYFPDYQHDVNATLAHVRALGLPEPYYLIAHSMGGAIGLRSAMEGLPIKAAVFSAPMWGILMSAALRPIAWGLSTLSKPLRFSHIFAPGQQAEPYVMRAEFAENRLTSDRVSFDHMRAQLEAHPDLCLGGPSLHWLNEALLEIRKLNARPSPALPCITFVGEFEEIVDPEASKARMARWPGGECVVVPDARHEVLMETPEIREAILDRTAELFHGATAAVA